MTELESNLEPDHLEKKDLGNSVKSDPIENEILNRELRTAIDEMTVNNQIENSKKETNME